MKLTGKLTEKEIRKYIEELQMRLSPCGRYIGMPPTKRAFEMELFVRCHFHEFLDTLRKDRDEAEANREADGTDTAC